MVQMQAESPIYNAFEYVADSFKYGDEEEKFEEFRPTPFLFDSTSANAESSFEVYCTLPGDKSERTYNYGFCINKEGVTEKWLNSKAKTARKFGTVFFIAELRMKNLIYQDFLRAAGITFR